MSRSSRHGSVTSVATGLPVGIRQNVCAGRSPVCRTRGHGLERVHLTEAATRHDSQRRNRRTRRTKPVISAGFRELRVDRRVLRILCVLRVRNPPPRQHMIVNALSVDVEEYFHASIFRLATRVNGQRSFESRVEASVERLLTLLAASDTRATFFTLGAIAKTHPSLVRRIAVEGHEIACHGDRHEDVCRQTPREFRRDIRRARARLEDLVGASIVGYRAPNFSIQAAQSWAYEILLEQGFRY